ncbi:hypothetical protein BA895_16965 [Humibacillus sp. DSM 29435]|uniref:hypothetical protein n=1 Tax=Humibacillus sp. DSM 29435 TaxID=1869167 RepID=UPI000872C500|nr:hypothetical protein [Humibacillus sp. DSM 29435]OFE17159.1 hypothetical protein BA895_16965 [Humibacillus sp. DSM 29435]
MAVTQTEIDTLVEYCNVHLGDPQLWTTPEGYPKSLALCIIDAIYSTGSHYTSVINVIQKYKTVHGTQDGARALSSSIAHAGGTREWATTVVGNLKPAHTRLGAPLKADIIQQAAQLITSLDIDTVDDLVARVADKPLDNPVHAGWKRLPSQSSGITYNYLLILAGLPSVKPDRMVLRFLAAALGDTVELSSQKAVELITETADHLNISPRSLDHIAWRAASGRELTD